MPGAIQAGDELRQRAITLDEEMRRDLQVGNFGEEGVLIRRQAVLEERLHPAGTELSRRQADVVHHEQRDLAVGTGVEVG